MRGTGDFGLTLSSKIELALSIDATLLIDLDLNNDGVAPDSNGAGKSAALVLFYYVYECIQYEVSAFRIFHLNLVCLYLIAFVTHLY